MLADDIELGLENDVKVSFNLIDLRIVVVFVPATFHERYALGLDRFGVGRGLIIILYELLRQLLRLRLFCNNRFVGK